MHDEELLHRYFDGALGPDERVALEARLAATPALRATVRALGAHDHAEVPGADFDRRVLAAVAVPAQRLRVRPGARSLALAASLVAFALGIAAGRGADTLEGLLHPGKVRVEFVFREPAAASVTVVGDFNRWDSAAGAMRQSGGAWTRTLWIAPGVHEYQFVIDGARREADPAAPAAAEDGFGARNSVIHVASVQAL